MLNTLQIVSHSFCSNPIYSLKNMASFKDHHFNPVHHFRSPVKLYIFWIYMIKDNYEHCENNSWQIVSIILRKLTGSMKGWKGLTHETKFKFGQSMTHDLDPEVPNRLQKFSSKKRIQLISELSTPVYNLFPWLAHRRVPGKMMKSGLLNWLFTKFRILGATPSQ